MKVQESAFIFPIIMNPEKKNMNFTKHFLGTKMLAIMVVLMAMTAFSSCDNNGFYENYSLWVKNNYFESIDSVAIDEIIVPVNIEVDSAVVCAERITNSIHELICYTHSNLKLIVRFKAISTAEQIVATIHQDGSITLR